MIQDAIFSPSFGNRPNQLVGRDLLLNKLLAGLSSPAGSKERAILLLGQRGFGKTVLLWELAERASKIGYVAATPTIASEGMLERIIEKIQDEGERLLKEDKMKLTGASAGVLGFSVGLQFTPEIQQTKSSQYRLSQLAHALTNQNKGLLILVDELQANSEDVRKLVITYQELVGERQNIALVMAGLPGAVSATLNDKVLTFLNRSSKIELEPLANRDIDAFLKNAFIKMNIKFSDELRHKAVESIDGSPYMLQLLGHSLVLYSDENDEIDDDILNTALESSKLDFENDICLTSLSALSNKDKDFLYAMSQLEDPTKMKDIAAKMNVTSDYAQKYRRRLLDAGIIKEAGFGNVTFAIPLLRDFLSRLD